MQITKQRFDSLFNGLILVLFTLLIFGIPLAFTAYTRSVFEVNKLLVLRITLILVYFFWFVKYLIYKHNGFDNKEEESYSLLGFRWKRVGLELPVLAWILVNYISSFLSENIFISYIGAYDRWEGMSTILNYVCLVYMFAKLIDSFKYRYWIIAMLIFSTFFSAFYGVLQSLGIEFMNWNADPTKRVFACINNPVHFCAYVAMLVPLGIGFAQRLLHWNQVKKIPVLFQTNILVRLIIPSILFISSFFFIFKSVSFSDYAGLAVFTAPHMLYSILFFGGLFILNNYTTIMPNKITVIGVTCYVLFLLFITLANVNTLSATQLFSLLFCLASFYVCSALNDKRLFFYRAAFFISMTLYYAMILSYSRATLVGFSIGMAFFFIFLINSNKSVNFKIEFKQVLFQAIGLFLINIAFIFRLQLHSTKTLILFCCFLIISFVCFWLTTAKSRSLKDILISVLFFNLLLLPLFDFTQFKSQLLSNFLIADLNFVMCFLAFTAVFFCGKYLPKKFLIISLLLTIFIGITFFLYSVSMVIFIFSLILYTYKKVIPQFKHIDHEIRFHIFITLIFMLILTALPQLSLFIAKFKLSQTLAVFPFTALLIILCLFFYHYFLLYINKPTKKSITYFILFLIFITSLAYYPRVFSDSSLSSNKLIKTNNNVTWRMSNLAREAPHNARWYMWLSVPPWILDYPLFGSGPDSIRYMYPKYRHPYYGIAEGGHNFTPDRLHNEYLNTLVTRGILGFVIYYGFFIGGWFYLMLKLFNKYFNKEHRVFILALMSGASIYLIQVIFNFGVVATLAIFYIIIGLGLSFINNET
ncbi:hypothetical protein DID76_03645 [Candidatus Marinamargulisbacteria bacterium SCGC AG-414-C22]|nr:hypothetical protein DID76_03645 [Candidatus Marinamargulisbacteria bacterium SCGC AG-414-C22]